jgi:ubiquinone/menaquinone biosynthesis C-methylase UbiE
VATNDTGFAGSIPGLYDRYLGPVLFDPYAADMARRLSRLSEGAVLEIAAGTGIVTRRLAEALPAAVRIVASDLNQPMLDHAASQPGLSRVAFRQADALDLPFADGEFDVVVCQFGAMFFSDRPTAYREARRVLKPGGHFIFSVWGALAHNPLSEAIEQSLANCFPQDPPRFLSRTPHGYHDEGTIRSDLHAAGFADPMVEVVALVGRVPSHSDPATGLCQGSPLRNEIVARDPDGLRTATDAAAAAIAERFGTGAIEAPMQAYVVTASR